MDIAVYIYWVLIVITIGYPNYIFFKKLKNVKGKPIIHKLLYFLITLILLFAIIAVIMTILTSSYLEKMGLKIDHNSYITRIMYAALVFPLAYLANIYIAKFYLKRISKTKNEIELIGKE
jgi:hypothetical protein